jgi:hypothetical protein
METIAEILERAWEQAYPGREAAERNAAWRELWVLQSTSEPVRPLIADGRRPLPRSAPRHHRSEHDWGGETERD